MKKVFFLFIIFISVSVFAEDRSVDLDECINIALQNHPDLFGAIEDNKKSVANYRIAQSAKSIIVNGTIKPEETKKDGGPELSEPHTPGKDTNIGLYTGLVVGYSLYDGRIEFAEEIARTGIDISKIESQKTKNEVFLGVKNSYYAYLLAKNNLKVREEISAKYKKKFDLARQLFEQGSKPILDVSRANLDVTDSELRLEKSRNNERKTKLNLFQSMGLEQVESLSINPKDVESIPDITCNLDELYKMAEIYSPVIRIITLQKRQAKLKISLDNAAHLPKVDLGLLLGYTLDKVNGTEFSDNLDSANWSPTFYGTVTASIPVYSGGRISAQVDSSTSDYYNIVYNEKKMLIDIKNQIRDNYKSLEEIKKQLEMSTLITKNAQRYLLLAQRSYENGAGTLLELQDAELSVINAEIGYLESKYGYLMTLAKLTSIIGIGEGSICKNLE